jgi:hypothetical protein
MGDSIVEPVVGPGHTIIRIDAVGPRLVLPEGVYRIAPAPQCGVESDIEPGDGGVVYHTRLFEEGDDKWEPAAVLSIGAAWVVYEREGRRLGLTPDGFEVGGRRRVGLVRVSDDGTDDDKAEGAPLVPGGRLWQTEHGWAGEGWSLEAHPCARARLRPWTWVESVSWHGMSIRIRHGRSHDEVRAWLARHAPLPYVPTEPDRFEDAFASKLRARITLFDGVLDFLRISASDQVEAIDSGLLDDLARGALGPFVWDVVEEDWYVHVASGEDPASLGEYLDPARDEAPFREKKAALTTRRSFDLRTAATPDALARELASQLGGEGVASLDDFERWLATRPVPSLPRRWELRVHPDLAATGMGWFTEVFFRAQPRLLPSWTVQ